MDVNTVANFNGDFAKILMAAVHGVSQLQGSNFAPAAFFENLAGFFRSMLHIGIFNGILGFAEHLDRPGQAELFLFHDHLDAGVIVMEEVEDSVTARDFIKRCMAEGEEEEL